MKKIVPALVAAVAIAAVPAVGAQAKPSGKGERGADRGADRHNTERGSSKSKRCKKPTRRGFVVRGALSAYTAETVTLEVERANKHAKRWLRSNDPVFETEGVRFSFEGVTDSTGDGVVDLADVVPTDDVRVIGKLSTPKRRCEGETTLKVRKIAVTRETEEEEQEAEEQQQEVEQPAAA